MFENMFGGGTRRRMMMNCEKNSGWDYELYPADGSEEGEFLVRKINVIAGQKLTINYYATVGQGYIIDFRNTRTGYGVVDNFDYFGWVGNSSWRGIVGSDDIREFEISSDGEITISGHRTDSDGELASWKTDRFIGKYIKIKIE